MRRAHVFAGAPVQKMPVVGEEETRPEVSDGDDVATEEAERWPKKVLGIERCIMLVDIYPRFRVLQAGLVEGNAPLGND